MVIYPTRKSVTFLPHTTTKISLQPKRRLAPAWRPFLKYCNPQSRKRMTRICLIVYSSHPRFCYAVILVSVQTSVHGHGAMGFNIDCVSFGWHVSHGVM